MSNTTTRRAVSKSQARQWRLRGHPPRRVAGADLYLDVNCVEPRSWRKMVSPILQRYTPYTCTARRRQMWAANELFAAVAGADETDWSGPFTADQPGGVGDAAAAGARHSLPASPSRPVRPKWWSLEAVLPCCDDRQGTSSIQRRRRRGRACRRRRRCWHVKATSASDLRCAGAEPKNANNSTRFVFVITIVVHAIQLAGWRENSDRIPSSSLSFIR